MTKTNDHQIWLEAHYALGKLEVEQGFLLDWRERSAFIKKYMEEHGPEFPLRKDEQ